MARPKRTESGEDRISDLPDEILHHILSFLPTKQAVRTSILSTRWRNLYASAPILYFDDEFLWNVDDEIRSRTTESFMNCIDRVFFFHHMSRIQRFCLKFGELMVPGRVHGWISAALLCDVEELSLTSNDENFTLLPLSVFTCKKLVVLKLELDIHCEKFLTVSTNVCLPSLKTLQLKNVGFLDESSIRLFSSCPVLEDLEMYDCRSESCMSILNPKLKRLTLSNPDNYESESTPIVIDAPSLLYFKYRGHAAMGHSFKNLHSLVEADLFLYNNPQQGAIDVLRQISNVQSLTIYCGVIELFSYKTVPVFDKTIHLDIAHCCGYLSCWKSFADLLEHLPNLETFVFSQVQQGSLNLEHLMTHLLSRPVPSCLSSHLKEMEIFSFRGEKYQMEMVQYFLKYAKALKKFVIHINRDIWELEEGELEITKALLKLPRGSKKCEVYII